MNADYLGQILSFVAIFSVLAASYSLVMGTAGGFSAMHAAFYGVGAYVGSMFAVTSGVPFPLDLIAGGGAAAILGLFVMLATWRLTGEAVLIATIALQLVATSVFINSPVTGGNAGFYGIPRPELFGRPVVAPMNFALLLTAAALVLLFILTWYLSRSSRLATRAIRDQVSVAESFGIGRSSSTVTAWVVSAGFAGIAGGLFARFVGYIHPESFSLHQTLTILTMLIVGGLGNIWGAAFGALILTVIPELVSFIPASSTTTDQLQPIVFSAVLLVMVMVRPQGLFPEPNVRSTARASKKKSPVSRVQTKASPHIEGAIQMSGITKSFGGLQVLRGIDLELRPNEVTAVLGPNGAGKTTLFNIIAGAERADSGTVSWAGNDVTGMRSYKLARRGLARSFQDARMFESFTVFEYMLVAAHAQRYGTVALSRSVVPEGAKEEIIQSLTLYGLETTLDTKLKDLSYGQYKLLMLAALVYWGPTAVFFDELAAGLDAKSTAEVAAHVRALRSPGRVICLVEHNLEFVWAAADRIVLLGEGRIVADGTPSEVRENPEAFATYFGKAELP